MDFIHDTLNMAIRRLNDIRYATLVDLLPVSRKSANTLEYAQWTTICHLSQMHIAAVDKIKYGVGRRGQLIMYLG